MDSPAGSQGSEEEPQISEKRNKHTGHTNQSIHGKIISNVDVWSNLSKKRAFVRVEVGLNLREPRTCYLNGRDGVANEGLGRNGMVRSCGFRLILIRPFSNPNISSKTTELLYTED